MTPRTAAALLFITMYAATALTAAAQEPPSYTAYYTGSEMAMDGILDEPAWREAESVGEFVFPWYESGEKEQTVAKILWDDERIYFAFACEDKWIAADLYRHFEPVSRNDCCEAFICPSPVDGERLDYLNYELNCIGTWLVGYHARSRDLNFYWKDISGLEVGRVINGTCNDDSDTDNGWVLEFSVPFEHFRSFSTRWTKRDAPTDRPVTVDGFKAAFPPRDGQVMYIGLHRCGGTTNAQYSQWAPSRTDRPSFHRPEDFGKVTFSRTVVK